MTRSTEPQPAIDHDGAKIVLVPLAGTGQKAKLFPKDYEALIAQGLTTRWCLNHNGKDQHYVRCNLPQRVPGRATLVCVARLIIGAAPGRQVRYRDGDRLNLRSDNIRLCKGRSPSPMITEPSK